MNRLYITTGECGAIFGFDEIHEIKPDKRIILTGAVFIEGNDYCRRWICLIDRSYDPCGMYPRWVEYRGRRYDDRAVDMLRELVVTERALETL